MSNLNKTYHKGKYRSCEWAKHLRPYLKRLGNKKFRKAALTLEEDDFERIQKHKYKKKKSNRKIKVKVTVRSYGDTKASYYKTYTSLKSLNDAIRRPNVFACFVISDSGGEMEAERQIQL